MQLWRSSGNDRQTDTHTHTHTHTRTHTHTWEVTITLRAWVNYITYMYIVHIKGLLELDSNNLTFTNKQNFKRVDDRGCSEQ